MSESEVSKDSTRNLARRKILRTLVVGGGALTAAKVTPEQWTKPVVEAVVLPSHATTSVIGRTLNPFGNFSSGPVMVDAVNPISEQLLADEPISEELLEFFMPSANAQPMCSNLSCDVEFSASVQNSSMSICWTGDTVGSAFRRVDPGGQTAPGITPIPGSLTAIGDGAHVGPNWQFPFVNASGMLILTPGGAPCAPEEA
ncbi:MAG: hypothetical protein WBM41_06580 [Arenicellales bacterium]